MSSRSTRHSPTRTVSVRMKCSHDSGKTLRLGVAAVYLALALAIPAHGQGGIGLCGNPHDNGPAYGPFDYRTATASEKEIVERVHFTPSVETLQTGNTGTLGGDLHYTLNVFPNHARALYAMTRLAERLKTNRPPGAKYLVECYYDRAVRYAPDDANVRVLYAIYLIDHKRPQEARVHLDQAERGIDDPQVTYNLGLAYFDLQEYDKALVYAKKARQMGIALTGLRTRLERAGKWRE